MQKQAIYWVFTVLFLTAVVLVMSACPSGKAPDEEPPADDTPVVPEKKVELCHQSPAGEDGTDRMVTYETLSVSESAVHAHVAHGDTLGACIVPEFPEPSDEDGPDSDDQGGDE